jgi:hypothetical protein
LTALDGDLSAVPSSLTVLVRDDDEPLQSGQVTFWNGESVTETAALQQSVVNVADGSGSSFQNIVYDASAETLTVELWVLPSELGQNFDLKFLVGDGVTVTETAG